MFKIKPVAQELRSRKRNEVHIIIIYIPDQSSVCVYCQQVATGYIIITIAGYCCPCTASYSHEVIFLLRSTVWSTPPLQGGRAQVWEGKHPPHFESRRPQLVAGNQSRRENSQHRASSQQNLQREVCVEAIDVKMPHSGTAGWHAMSTMLNSLSRRSDPQGLDIETILHMKANVWKSTIMEAFSVFSIALAFFLYTAFGSTMITYEEMVKVNPQVKRPRPILLVGKFKRHGYTACYKTGQLLSWLHSSKRKAIQPGLLDNEACKGKSPKVWKTNCP